MNRRRRIKSGWLGSRSLSATSASRIPRSRSSSDNSKLQLDLRVEIDELAEPRGQPIGAEAQRRRDPQFAVRLLPAVDEPTAHSVELEDHVAHGAEQHFALLGQNEAAGMAMKQRRAEVGLQRPDLSADRRLAEAQRLARMGERPSVGGRLKDAQLIPIHERFLGPAGPIAILLVCSAGAGGGVPYSAAARFGSWAASQRSASSAAMQPRPAAVTA